MPTQQNDIHPQHPPVVPVPQGPFIPKGRLQRIVDLFPPGQFLRYLCVGVFNTAFGYGLFALTLFLLNHSVAQRYLYLTVIAASLISTPVSITVAYFGYKLFVFQTRGNHLREWLKAFGVYGVGMLPGLLVLSALTRLLQSVLHHKSWAGYVAGALVQGFTVIISFLGHKKVTFRPRPVPS
jgi:putative flippase GtrA